MAERRRRHLRRDALVFLGSLAGHLLLFWVVLGEFHFYRLPQATEQAVQVEIVPEQQEPIPPPVFIPHIKETPAPTPQPPSPPPAPTPQPPTPQAQVTQRPAPVQAPTPTAPTQAQVTPTPTPTPRPAPAPTPIAPAPPAPQPGPPKPVSASSLVQQQQQTATQAPKIVLHRSKEQNALAPSVSIPGAVFAPPTAPPTTGAPGAPGGGAPGGQAGAAGLPGGALPGFGRGLRGGVLGCANAEALHFTPEEKARCAEAFGNGAKESPVMDAIDASKRQALDQQAASAAAAQKYRDSTPAGTESTPIAGQPRVGHSPGE